jgi:hypothetical protein
VSQNPRKGWEAYDHRTVSQTHRTQPDVLCQYSYATLMPPRDSISYLEIERFWGGAYFGRRW